MSKCYAVLEDKNAMEKLRGRMFLPCEQVGFTEVAFEQNPERSEEFLQKKALYR